MERGTDINFGTLSAKLIEWLGQQKGCGYATSHRITNPTKEAARWGSRLRISQQKKDQAPRPSSYSSVQGVAASPLLQKSGIKESKGFGGFPIGGQWLIQ